MGDARVTITSRDRVYFPDSGQTKGDLADYYAAVAPLMLPFASGRPLSLVRCPQGRSNKCFFQRHLTGGFGPHVTGIPITEKNGATEDYLFIEGTAGLLECVQMGTIEFHLWASCVGDIEAPDRMVFDLDPDEAVDFASVCDAALDVREQLEVLGLASFAMLTGGKGVHVVVPLNPGHSWDRHAGFAKALAYKMSESEPDRYTASSSMANRKGRIFIDYLRNQRGNSAIAPYSVRARSCAPVAVPVSWDELPDIESAQAYSIADAAELDRRAHSQGLMDWASAQQSLPDYDP